MSSLVFIVLIVLLFIPSFLMMRKQRRHQEEVRTMQANLKPGDLVVISSGVHGRVEDLTETTVQVEVAPGVVVTVERMSILRGVDPTPPTPVEGEGVADGDDHPENLR